MTSVLDLIGETPLVEVTQFERGPCRLFLKLESANPSGSIKDRPARAMIEAAEADGRLKAGGTIVEATAETPGLVLPWSERERATAFCWSFQTKWHVKKSCTAKPWAPKSS